MNKDKFCLSTDVVELSEENQNYLLMTDRVCFYDEPNLNGCKLPSDGAENFAQTLIDMPVYAKCRVNDKGEPTFGSHEAGIDEDGELFFDTVPIGVHTSVEIKDDTVSVGGIQKTLPCLFATQKIWTRNKNAVAAIKRLFSEGKLHNSWELQNNEYTYSNGIKTITDYEFLGNTFLGYEYADPAYGESAKVLSISQEEQLMVAEALSQDLLDQENSKEDESLNKDTKNPIVEPETTAQNEPVVENPVEPVEPTVSEGDVGEQPAGGEEPIVTDIPEDNGSNENETSSVTVWDIYDKVREAARNLLDKWCYVAFLFPEEHIALLKMDEGEDELSYVQVTYVVAEDDSVTVSDPVDVKLAVQVSEINAKINELNDTIASLNEELQAAKDEIEALKPYRDSAEKAAHDEKVEALRSYAADSKQFTDDELSSEEMTQMFDALDESAVKAMIADRVVASTEKAQKSETAQTVKNAGVYTGEPIAGETNDAKSIMRMFLGK